MAARHIAAVPEVILAATRWRPTEVPVPDDDFDSLRISLGGRPVAEPWDRLRRGCGLSWSGGPAVAGPYRFYDRIASADPDRVDAIDVVAAAALGIPLDRPDLATFTRRGKDLDAWLGEVPLDLRLADADDAAVEHVVAVARSCADVDLELLTAVLHRKRPLLVPIAGPHLVDRYRRYVGPGTLVERWPALLAGLRHDLRDPPNAITLAMMGVQLTNLLGHAPALLRRVDLLLRDDPA